MLEILDALETETAVRVLLPNWIHSRLSSFKIRQAWGLKLTVPSGSRPVTLSMVEVYIDQQESGIVSF